MYFWRRFLYVPCFIIFSQAGLDLGNNEIHAVSKTLALGNEGNTRGMRVTSPHAELPRGHCRVLHSCFLRLSGVGDARRYLSWQTPLRFSNKFQNPKSFLFFMGVISRFSGENECLVMKYTSEFENYKSIFLNMAFLGVFVAVMRVITLVSWSPQDRQWAHTHSLTVTAF